MTRLCACINQCKPVESPGLVRFVFTLAFMAVFVLPCDAVAQDITVAVAANMQFAFKEIKSSYEKYAQVKVNAVFGSSGKLTAQVKNGAPFDLFLSANMVYPRVLRRDGFAGAEPRVYAYGKLVVCTTQDIGLSDLSGLTDGRIKTIALADPKLAPYGERSLAILKRLGLLDELKEKIVLSHSVAQVNHFLVMQSVDAGLTSKSSYIANPGLAQACFDIPEKDYDVIEQGAVLIKQAQTRINPFARDFFNYLNEEPARVILRKHGYGVPE